jgi:hypothetical protein
MNNDNFEDKGFVLQLRMRAERKVQEYSELLHERQKLDMRIERTKEYIEQMNKFLEAEGQRPVHIKMVPPIVSVVGKPGNRSKTLPIRKMRWDGMSMNQIVEHILNASPTVSFHPKQVAPQIYEIESDSDLQMVIPNLRSTMQRGAREGLWERTGRAQFKAKIDEKQGELIDA